jgi:putative phosphoribosyl transferase
MRDTHVTDVSIPTDGIVLEGLLAMPERAGGIVAFAHGSGSGRFSPRNQGVAKVLQQSGLATLLLDLLTPEESVRDAATAEYRFDIPLLGRRVGAAVEWLAARPATAALNVGLFGASTGAGAALIAAAARPERVLAVVSRGGRPDLADDALERVRAPTLLIVGGCDLQVIELNEMAARRLGCEHELVIVPGATHLFEEPGALDHVARLAAGWFVPRLAGARTV